MSYKLYEFNDYKNPAAAKAYLKKQQQEAQLKKELGKIKYLKDRGHELDEQIRILCDILYNKRQAYEGQLSSDSGEVSSYRPGFDGNRPSIIRLFNTLDNEDPQGGNMGINDIFNAGEGTWSGTSSFEEGPYINASTGVFAGNRASKRSRPGIVLNHNIYFQTWVRMGNNTVDSTHTGQFLGLSTSLNPLTWHFGTGNFTPNGARIGFMRYNNAPDSTSHHPWHFNYEESTSPSIGDYGTSIDLWRLTGLPAEPFDFSDPDHTNYYFMQFQLTWTATDTFNLEAQVTEYDQGESRFKEYTNFIFGPETITFDETVVLGCVIENLTMSAGGKTLFWNHSQVEEYKPNMG